MAKLIYIVKSKLPTKEKILPVFSIIVFIYFSWALYRMFWLVPSWLGYLNIWNVLALTAYVLSFALIESLFILLAPLFCSLVYPARMFKDKFVSQGSMVVFVLSAAAVMIQRKIGLIYKWELIEIIAYPTALVVGLMVFVVVFNYILERLEILQSIILKLAERMTIFLYIYIPLGLLGSAVVLLRNIF